MKKNLLITGIICLCFLRISIAQSQTEEINFLSADSLQKHERVRPVIWKYHPGDNKEWANPAFDDSAWETVRTDLEPGSLPENGWKGIGWFRAHFHIDSTLWYQPLGLSVRQAGASEVYLDGVLICTFGEVGLVRSQMKHNRDNKPKAFSFDGKNTHVIAVRYSNYSFEIPHRIGLDAGFELFLGNINNMVEQITSSMRLNTGFQMFFMALPLAFGLLHLILFLFSPHLKENLYYAIFLFFYAAGTFFNYQIFLTEELLIQQLLNLRIHRALMLLGNIFKLRFMYSLFYKTLPKRFWIFSLGMVVSGLFAVYNPVGNFNYFLVMVVVLNVEILRVIIEAVSKKKDGAWIIAVGFIIIFIFSSYDLLLNFNLITPVYNMRNAYFFGSIGLFIVMSIYLARNFARANERILEQERAAKEKEIGRRLLEAENERKTQELEEARQLQLSMLPKCERELAGLEMCFEMKTATEVGGDYYDYLLADDGTLTVAIGDATGHGMKAGTMVATIKGLFSDLSTDMEITEFFNKCTEIIKRMNLGNLYMGMTLVRIKDRKMTASAAGMTPLFIYRYKTAAIEEITLKGMPLGAHRGFKYQTAETGLSPGDVILLMSDGFPELFNEKGEMLDYPAVIKNFKEAVHFTPDEIAAHLMSAGEKWRGERPQDDDITFVILKVK